MRITGICRDKNKGLGVTSHGLRHEYINRLFARITGKPSPIKGGQDYDPQSYKLAICMARAGHGDIYKLGAYAGSPRLVTRIRKLTELLSADVQALAPAVPPKDVA